MRPSRRRSLSDVARPDELPADRINCLVLPPSLRAEHQPAREQHVDTQLFRDADEDELDDPPAWRSSDVRKILGPDPRLGGELCAEAVKHGDVHEPPPPQPSLGEQSATHQVMKPCLDRHPRSRPLLAPHDTTERSDSRLKVGQRELVELTQRAGEFCREGCQRGSRVRFGLGVRPALLSEPEQFLVLPEEGEDVVGGDSGDQGPSVARANV